MQPSRNRRGPSAAGPSEITPWLLLGNKFHRYNTALLAELKVSHVLSCIGGAVVSGLPFQHELVPMSDTGDSCLQDDILPRAFKFINKARAKRGGRVLLHCREGVNRSPAVVVACLMFFESKTLKEAHHLVSTIHTLTCIHDDYMSQLRAYDLKLFGKHSTQQDELLTTSKAMAAAVANMQQRAQSCGSWWLRYELSYYNRDESYPSGSARPGQPRRHSVRTCFCIDTLVILKNACFTQALFNRILAATRRAKWEAPSEDSDSDKMLFVELS
eukprot:g42628.t1